MVRLQAASMPLPAAVLEDLLRRLDQARLVRTTDGEGRTRYELRHQYLAEHVAAWIEAYEHERMTLLKTIQEQYAFYRLYGWLLSQEALALYEKHREELPLPPELSAYMAESAKERHDTQAKNEKTTRSSERAQLIAVVSGYGGGLGALTRMVLSWVFGSFVFLPGGPTTLSAWLNPAWQGLFGTVVGAILVVWVLEALPRDHGRLSLKSIIGFVMIGALWGFAMSTIITGAFRPESLHLLGWDTHYWGYPLTGTCWGVGLALGTYVGNTWRGPTAPFASVLRQRYWGGLCGAVGCLLFSPLLLDMVSRLFLPEPMAMRRAWGEAWEQSLSVWAVLTWYYRHPVVTHRPGTPTDRRHGSRPTDAVGQAHEGGGSRDPARRAYQ